METPPSGPGPVKRREGLFRAVAFLGPVSVEEGGVRGKSKGGGERGRGGHH